MPVETSKGIPQAVGNYDILQKIADGGMGSVYKGRNRTTGEIVAIKIVPPSMANNAVLLQRFEQEYRVASSLDHPNIVKAIEFGYEGSTPYLVMEFVDGETLGQRIDRVGRLPEKEAIHIIAQVAKGLHKAHKHGLVHRDVKPDNVLLTKDNVAKLADLGLVKVKEVETDLNLTRTGRGLGTPHFMAPEQFRNAKEAQIECDVYSLGATLYMAVTGELPFRSCSPLDAWMKKTNNDFPAPKDVVPELSDRVDWAIRRAMSADPKNRPAGCREFVEDLTGHSTRPKVATSSSGVNGSPPNLWYLTYPDENGTMHTVKGTLEAIRTCLKEGRLGDAANVCVSRTKAGPFEPLRTHPEYRDLVIEPSGGMKSGVRKDGVRAIKDSLRPPAAQVPTPVRPQSSYPTPKSGSYRPPTINVGPPPTAATTYTWITWAVFLVIAAGAFFIGWRFLSH